MNKRRKIYRRSSFSSEIVNLSKNEKYLNVTKILSESMNNFYNETRPSKDSLHLRNCLRDHVIECISNVVKNVGKYKHIRKNMLKYCNENNNSNNSNSNNNNNNNNDSNSKNSNVISQCIVSFGSTMWGIDTRTSDIDMAIHIPSFIENSIFLSKTLLRTNMVDFLKALNKQLNRSPIVYDLENENSNRNKNKNKNRNRNRNRKRYLDLETRFKAKIPIIKARDNINDIECDISIAQRWTNIGCKLISKYCNFNNDSRIQTFMVTIKHWSKMRGINDAYNGYINSYGYTLLAIKFLQSVEPPILPIYRIDDSGNDIYCFQKIPNSHNSHNSHDSQQWCKDKKTSDMIQNVSNKNNNNDKLCKDGKSENRMSVGELLIRFPFFLFNGI